MRCGEARVLPDAEGGGAHAEQVGEFPDGHRHAGVQSLVYGAADGVEGLRRLGERLTLFMGRDDLLFIGSPAR